MVFHPRSKPEYHEIAHPLIIEFKIKSDIKELKISIERKSLQ